MKQKLIKTAIQLVTLLACGVGVFSYRAFHSSGAWIVRSPANQRWAVDLVASGFTDIGQDFRVHDITASPFLPRYICDLFWEHRHSPNEIHWSRDGSVAAITVGFVDHTGHFYGCAYDFLQHRPLRTGSFGSPLEPSPAFTSSIDQLLAARGGLGSVIPIPDVTKPNNPESPNKARLVNRSGSFRFSMLHSHFNLNPASNALRRQRLVVRYKT